MFLPVGFELDIDVRRLIVPLAAPIVQDLKALGLRPQARVVDEKEFWSRLERRESSIHVLRFFCFTGDGQEVLDELIHSPDAGRGLGAFNFSFVKSPIVGLDEEIEASRREMAGVVRMRKLQSAMRRALDSRLAIPLVREKEITFTSPDVVFTPRADTLRLLSEARFAP